MGVCFWGGPDPITDENFMSSGEAVMKSIFSANAYMISPEAKVCHDIYLVLLAVICVLKMQCIIFGGYLTPTRFAYICGVVASIFVCESLSAYVKFDWEDLLVSFGLLCYLLVVQKAAFCEVSVMLHIICSKISECSAVVHQVWLVM